MTQVIAAVHQKGIAVASDSRAIRLDQQGPERILTVQKLFPLGSHAFVLSAGIGLGVPLSGRLQAFMRTRGLHESEDILSFAGPFLSQQYRGILSARSFRPQNDSLERLLFLIGGSQGGSSQRPHRLLFLSSEQGRTPLEEQEVSRCISIPRSLSAEMHIERMLREGQSPDAILAFFHDFLRRRAEEEEGVGPPYCWGLLDREGLRLGQWSAQEGH